MKPKKVYSFYMLAIGAKGGSLFLEVKKMVKSSIAIVCRREGKVGLANKA